MNSEAQGPIVKQPPHDLVRYSECINKLFQQTHWYASKSNGSSHRDMNLCLRVTLEASGISLSPTQPLDPAPLPNNWTLVTSGTARCTQTFLHKLFEHGISKRNSRDILAKNSVSWGLTEGANFLTPPFFFPRNAPAHQTVFRLRKFIVMLFSLPEWRAGEVEGRILQGRCL